MFTLKKDKSRLDEEIDKLTKSLVNLEVTSKEYTSTVEQISKLHKIRQDSKPDRPSWNTGLTVAANILGIILITRYEKEHVVTSKALGFIKRI